MRRVWWAGCLVLTFCLVLAGWGLPRAGRVLGTAPSPPAQLWSEPQMAPSVIALPGTVGASPTTAAAGLTGAQPSGTGPPAATGNGPTGTGLAGASPTPTTPRNYPPPGVGASPTPLGTPAVLAAEDPRYTFSAFQADGTTPVAYDPCRAIHYVTRPDNAPPEAAALVRNAFDRLTEVTGLQFVDDGVTDEAPAADRAAYQPQRYGDRWAPVLVAWATEEEVPAVAGRVVGAAGSTTARIDGAPAVYVTGGLTLDGPALQQVWDDTDTRAAVRSVVLHEMAHLVGLGHVADDSQLMNPQSSAATTVLDYQAGDLSGLVKLGAGPCVPDI